MKPQQRLLLLLLLVYHCNLIAQNNRTITVKAGHTIEESEPTVDLYEYSQFTHGTVFSRDGNISGGSMNYHRFLDAMLFLTPTGDTFTLTNKKNIMLINIGTDTFFTARDI